jgi:Putative porin
VSHTSRRSPGSSSTAEPTRRLFYFRLGDVPAPAREVAGLWRGVACNARGSRPAGSFSSRLLPVLLSLLPHFAPIISASAQTAPAIAVPPTQPAQDASPAVQTAPASQLTPAAQRADANPAIDPGRPTQPDPSAQATPSDPRPQQAAQPSPSPTPIPRSQNVTINLINRLVQRGVLTKEDAAELIKEAEEDAAAAKAEAARANAEGAHAAQAAAAGAQAAQAPASAPSNNPPLANNYSPAPGSPSQTMQTLTSSPPLVPDLSALPSLTPPPTPQPPANQSAEPPPALVAGPNDTVRVTYIPEIVKKQLRQEISQEVLDQAREENWAAPRTFPDWVSRIRFFGDFRFRFQGIYYPPGNDDTGAFPNFNAINTGPPFDTTGNVFPPELNVNQNRNMFRIRARVGLEANLGDGFTIGIRGATGQDNSPVTENQTIGVANNAQGGNFSKYSIWLDRAFLRYELGGLPNKDLSITVGRFDNPFFSTTMLWAEDLGFDGFVLQARYEVLKGLTPFLAAGIFPVFNTDLNFATNNPSKFPSENKWLFAGQIGPNWRINKDFTLKLGVAYYGFENIEGKLSSPFVPLTSSDAGNTDDSRPSFAQNGNTYMALRDILATSQNDFGTIDQFQYYGLASNFRELAVTGQIDFSHFDPIHVLVYGEYANNLAFNATYNSNVAVNNRGPVHSNGALGPYVGGDTAWIAGLIVGNPVLEKAWDWNLFLNYRYVDSDALVDGFCDSDFGGGGTNLKGYTVGGSLGLGPNVWIRLRWMSANSVAGPTFKNDILQVDVNGRF